MPRRGENIYKRKDKRWEGRYIKERIDNKVLYGYVYAHSYNEVKKKLEQAKQETLIKDVKPSAILFNSVAVDWFEFVQPQFKESTKVKYTNLLKLYILPVFGEQPLEKITIEQIELFCKDLLISGGKNKDGLSTKTVSDILSLIRNILNFSSTKGFPKTEDISLVKIKQSTKEMKILSSIEQEKLCNYLYENLNNINIGILLCLFTGIRIGEVCALQWEDISINEKTIYIHQTMQRLQCENENKKTKIIITTPKSSCSIRIIPLPENLTKIIDEYPVKKTGYFLTSNPQKFVEPRVMENHLKRILQKLAISEVNFHALRHTFATRCVELGFDIKSLSEVLGHASVNITMNRYVHPSMELKRENMQKLSELIAVK